MNRSGLLIECGFAKGLLKKGVLNQEMVDRYYTLGKTGGFKLKEKVNIKELSADEEEMEVALGKYSNSGYPKSLKIYQLSWEVYDLSLEEPYFWVLDTLKRMFEHIEKLEDSFAAAENSAFFGVTQQRLGAQQDKVSQFLATMGKMIKELFQMVRELRIIDERLGYYEGVEKQLQKPLNQRGRSDEITLKGLFVDLVQGGGKSAASVYGMARELEFITLPDLFFDAPPFKDAEELEQHIKSLEESFNRNVIRVLQRHLHQYNEWRRRTYQEHKNRKQFMKQYLWQHYEIIKMYLNWVKPYLRNVARLTMKEKNMESADLISAFEGSMLDIEVLARNNKDKANGCILATFNYRTRPEMKVVQEGYQRGPVHMGKMLMTLRAYNWTDEQVEGYKRLKEEEAFLLMGEVSSSVKSAMESLGEELRKYLDEAKDDLSKKEPVAEELPGKTFMEKFFGDFYTPKKKKLAAKSAKASSSEKAKQIEALNNFKKEALGKCWVVYRTFKKGHQMVQW